MSTISPEIYKRTIRYFLGPVAGYLDDDAVREIMINGPDEIFIEERGAVVRADVRFSSDEELESAAINIAQFVGRQLSDQVRRFDARMPEGHRVHVVLPPLCKNGVSITIRKHSGATLTLDKLVEYGSLNELAVDCLRSAVSHHQNLIVSGGTGTGKTTLLNAVSSLIPPDERIITIEDAAELQLQQEHVVRLEARPPDRKGRGAYSIRDLFVSTLRMRPDRVVVGECRGGEALDMLQAMNSGHGGSMSTLHANSTADALKRLETLALFAGEEIPLRVVRAQVASAINVIVQIQRLKGRRLVTAISQCLGLDDAGNYLVEDLFAYDPIRDELERTETWPAWVPREREP